VLSVLPAGVNSLAANELYLLSVSYRDLASNIATSSMNPFTFGNKLSLTAFRFRSVCITF
jgi:hypothetical protein